MSQAESCGEKQATKGAFSQFRRSVSYILKASPKSSQPSTPPLATVDSDPDILLRPTKRKLTPFERFLATVRKKTDGSVELPPAHSGWSQPEAQAISQVSAAGENTPTVEALVEVVTPSSSPLNAPIPAGDGREAESADMLDAAREPPPSAEPDSGPDGIPEPMTLARRIQSLLSMKFPTYTPNTVQPLGSASSSDDASSALLDSNLRLPSFITDSKLVSLLSSPSIMNGSLSRGHQSVWTVLDRLRSGPQQTLEGSHDDHNQDSDVQADTDVSSDDSSSFMLYAPLIPDDYSEVEIAHSQVISLDEDASIAVVESGQTKERSRLADLWPFRAVRFGEDDDQTAPPLRPSEQKVWVPSTTQISFEIRWWGYRIYLPPPILAVLDNQRIEASKRAALLTTALKWILDHIPIAGIPPQLRPVVQLLMTLVPYLAYLGAFIAWSWGAIKGFDRGNGVILTATWLLPLALIPGTWQDDQAPHMTSSAGP